MRTVQLLCGASGRGKGLVECFINVPQAVGPIPLSHFWISATCGEDKYFYLVSLLEITRGQLLKGPPGIQLLGGLK